jgi:hypothetical protein
MCVCVCMYSPFQFLDQWTDFHEYNVNIMPLEDVQTT